MTECLEEMDDAMRCSESGGSGETISETSSEGRSDSCCDEKPRRLTVVSIVKTAKDLRIPYSERTSLMAESLSCQADKWFEDGKVLRTLEKGGK